MTIAEGSFVKVDRQSNLRETAHDYVVYTQLSGITANLSAISTKSSSQRQQNNQQMGIMRMVSAIDVNWVAPLLPKLKDPVDVDKLNYGRGTTTAKAEEETKTEAPLLGKRKAETSAINHIVTQEALADVAPPSLFKEEKLAQLKERFAKRQKKQ